ncbi:helix-turn-helix transcriptional regulator [Aliamphritea hakodatensis]|uniref:helix-turn-helix transcriptional regulator n=1 Tax=Aliamphritea hakodatensis TaxID=2895352 RepID=UPI0022FDA68E|nr:helix-turn-helix domain-containing protein [Aliamphritea hakodatensis]
MTVQVLTIKQFAERYALNPSTVSAQITRTPAQLPAFIRIGKQIRFPLAEIEAWEQSQISTHGASQNNL